MREKQRHGKQFQKLQYQHGTCCRIAGITEEENTKNQGEELIKRIIAENSPPRQKSSD